MVLLASRMQAQLLALGLQLEDALRYHSCSASDL